MLEEARGGPTSARPAFRGGAPKCFEKLIYPSTGDLHSAAALPSLFSPPKSLANQRAGSGSSRTAPPPSSAVFESRLELLYPAGSVEPDVVANAAIDKVPIQREYGIL